MHVWNTHPATHPPSQQRMGHPERAAAMHVHSRHSHTARLQRAWPMAGMAVCMQMQMQVQMHARPKARCLPACLYRSTWPSMRRSASASSVPAGT